MDAAPIIRNSRTMLPIRIVAESLGAKVGWNVAERKATVTNKNAVIEITIDSKIAKVNGKDVVLDTPAFIENNRTYLPLRFVAENLNATVLWDAKERQVIIAPKAISTAADTSAGTATKIAEGSAKK
jgi:N-acetylmuramoyl-L-alanine amidase